jgi:type II secretory pathway component PulF
VILQTLGRLFIAGRTVPEALDFLKANRSFPGVVQDRLQEATNRVNRGEPLEVALHQSELLPANMVPLVKAAQATQTLPWALADLGDHLAARSLRTVRRIVSLVSPICVVLIGVWVGFLTYGLLLPLIHLLNKLSGQ